MPLEEGRSGDINGSLRGTGRFMNHMWLVFEVVLREDFLPESQRPL